MREDVQRLETERGEMFAKVEFHPIISYLADYGTVFRVMKPFNIQQVFRFGL